MHCETCSSQLRNALDQLINFDGRSREIAHSLPAMAVKMTEERWGSWKFEGGRWVMHEGLAMKMNSFQFPTENDVYDHLKECLIRALFHPEYKNSYALSFRMPLLRIRDNSELGKKYVPLKKQLGEEAAIVSVSEKEPTYRDEKYLFAVSGNMIYIFEEEWYD